MKLRVRFQNEILGDDTFWEGEATDINNIRNVVAQQAAQLTAIDGKVHKIGMWIAEQILDEYGK